MLSTKKKKWGVLAKDSLSIAHKMVESNIWKTVKVDNPHLIALEEEISVNFFGYMP